MESGDGGVSARAAETLVLARVEESELADALERLEGLSEDEVMELLSGG